MRFSSDDEIFDQNSKNQQQADQSQDPKQTPVKKEKKETMLSKFLDSLDANTIKKLQNYQKLKRPVFQRRLIVPPKISLYEDVLFILAFKDYRQQTSTDGKQFKQICNDLESRTKRKQCTIKQRVQKKLCKMTPTDLLDHVANDKDISFNLKKVLTSGAKIQSLKSGIKHDSQTPEKSQKKEETAQKQEKIEMQQNEKTSLNSRDSPSKSSEIFQEKENTQSNQDKKVQEKEFNESEQIQKTMEEIDQGQIFIVFKKDFENNNIFMINRLIVEREIKQLRKKDQEKKKRQELLQQLKNQMDVIIQFRNKFSTIPHEVQMLIDEANKIMQVLSIKSIEEITNLPSQNIIQQKSATKNQNDATADRISSELPSSSKQQNIIQNQVTEFNIEEEIAQNQDQNQNQNFSEENATRILDPKYSIQFALCENPEYIKLYYSNPKVFEPLLWTQEEDTLIDNLMKDFESHEEMLNLLVRYKGPEMFIERVMFQKKAVGQGKLLDAIRNLKPLNMGKLVNHMNQMNEKIMIEEQNMMKEVM